MRIALILATSVVLFGLCTGCTAPSSSEASGSSVAAAYEQRKRDVQVEGEGVVTRVLPDDRQGSRHQRIIVRLASGQTVLIQHNIDLAERIADAREGDAISFFGEYIWNEQGGLVHWTHHDPAGRHVAGWIKHKGKMYQ